MKISKTAPLVALLAILTSTITAQTAQAELDIRGYLFETYARPVLSAANRCRMALTNIQTQINNTRSAMAEANAIVAHEMDLNRLYENIWAFRGFHLEREYKPYRARPWAPANPSAITLDDINSMTPEEFVAIVEFAMEIEMPIKGYSEQSGEGFQFLLPTMGRFMGKTNAQMDAVRAGQLVTDANGNVRATAWCESAWCHEEKRHAPFWLQTANAVRRLLGMGPAKGVPVEPSVVSSDLATATEHLYSRQSTEWNASSAYFLLASHSSGEFKDAIRQVIRDEVKHLSIMGAADAYIFGHTPNRRLFNIVLVAARQFQYMGNTRSTGQQVTDIASHFGTFMEILYIHMLVEKHFRQFIRTLPLATLREIYETPSKLDELEARELTAEEQANAANLLRLGHSQRTSLMRWRADQRREAMEQEAFNHTYSHAINEALETTFNGFRHSGPYNNAWRNITLSRIDTMEYAGFHGRDLTRLRAALRERLFDHLIRNNPHERLRREAGAAAFISPTETTHLDGIYRAEEAARLRRSQL